MTPARAAQPTRHLDLGCGARPRNPYGRDELYAVDMAAQDAEAARFRQANLVLDPIPFDADHFDSVSAYDFIEHVPRLIASPHGGTRLPFVELMNEVWRVLKPAGRFYALTPAWPNAEAFVDPTHVNVITERTWTYFCGEQPMARMYGYRGRFDMLRNEWALYPEAFAAGAALGWRRRYRRWRLRRGGRLSHLMWEFVCVKPA